MTAINGTPRPVNPPDNTAHTTTTVRRTGRTRPSRQRALAVALTAALLAGVSIAIDAAASTATTPPPPGTSARPIGTGATHVTNPLLGPTGFAPAPLSRGSNI